MKKIISILLAVTTILSLATIFAGAANVCSNVSGKSASWGGNTTTFYAKTNKSWLTNGAITFNFTQGTLGEETNIFENCKQYGYFEIKVYTKSSGVYKEYSKTNAKNVSNIKIKLPKNSDCKITVYAWKTKTIHEYISSHKSILDLAKCSNAIFNADSRYVYWKAIPKWSVAQTKNVSYCY